jgi:hypothetical protein
MIGKAPLDDEELGDSFVTPEDEESDEPEGGGGLFGSDGSDMGFRRLEQEGFPIQDRSECDGQVIEGPQGGLRCIPADGGGKQSAQDAQERVQELVDSDLEGEELKNELETVVADETGADEVDLSGFSDKQAAQTSEAFAALGAAGETEGITEISTNISEEMTSRSAMANYDPFDQAIRMDADSFTQENAEQWNDEGFLAGGGLNHMVAHEVGHHNHFAKDVDGQSAGMQAQTQEIPEQAQAAFAEQVSVYAVENPNEMVAELYAMQVNGEELSTGMENAYERFNGPEVNV